jgi:hypothetical protein
VFHVNIDFPGIFADTLEKMVKVYGMQVDEINTLLQNLATLEPNEKEQAEIDHLRLTLTNFKSILESTMRVLENTIKELRSQKQYKMSP